MKITVITIGLNACEGLRKTLESINAQTLRDFEHVIVDGGSTDGSIEVIQPVALRNPKWVSEPDQGIADALNKGTRLATGDYLCYLNAGDAFASATILEEVTAFLAAHSTSRSAVVYSDFLVPVDDEIRRVPTSARVEGFAWTNPLNHQSTFIPRDLALAHPYSERLALGMDYDFWLRIHPKVEFLKFDQPIAVFALGGRSSSKSWQLHNLIVRRVLWHINRGTRMDGRDLLLLAVKGAIIAVRETLRGLLGKA